MMRLFESRSFEPRETESLEIKAMRFCIDAR